MFIVTTAKAEYACIPTVEDAITLGWTIEVKAKKEKVNAVYRIGEKWARTRVFQFIDTIDAFVI